MEDLWMMRVFTSNGVSGEAVFHGKQALDGALKRAVDALEKIEDQPHCWHMITDDFGVTHVVDLKTCMIAVFSVSQNASRQKALAQLSQRLGITPAQPSSIVAPSMMRQ